MSGRAEGAGGPEAQSDMSDWPLVSVRMPLFNHEAYVFEALESVRLNDYPNKELVVIDDGSSDRSFSVAQEWLQKTQPDFPVQLRTRENRGLTRTLNELVEISNGEFLVSLASDDRLIVDGIRSRVSYLLAHPEKMAVIGDCHVIDQHSTQIHGSGFEDLYSACLGRYQTDQGLLDEILGNWAVPGSVLLVRKGLYDKVGLYDENLRVEDWDFYIRMVSQGLLGFVARPVSDYRVHADNTALARGKKFMNYTQLMKTAWKNIWVVPGSHRHVMMQKILGFGARALVWRGMQAVDDLKKVIGR